MALREAIGVFQLKSLHFFDDSLIGNDYESVSTLAVNGAGLTAQTDCWLSAIAYRCRLHHL